MSLSNPTFVVLVLGAAFLDEICHFQKPMFTIMVRNYVFPTKLLRNRLSRKDAHHGIGYSR
jgi:hypothetical protein